MKQIHPESAHRIDQCLASVTVDKQPLNQQPIQKPQQASPYCQNIFYSIKKQSRYWLVLRLYCFQLFFHYIFDQNVASYQILEQQYYNIMKETRSYYGKGQQTQTKEDKTETATKPITQNIEVAIQTLPIHKMFDLHQQSFEVNQCQSNNFSDKQNRISNSRILRNKNKKIKKRTSAIVTQKKIFFNELEFPLNSDEPERYYKEEENNWARKKCIFADGYGQVSEEDFRIMASKNKWQKSFSTVLLNQYGLVIYADRLGSQHFQGSLNNFQKNPFHWIIVQKQRSKILKALANIRHDESTIIKYFIYSKNIKRRYSKVTSEQSYVDEDLFFRYLKGLSTKILPIQIQFQNYKDYEGYWNQNLVKNNVPLKCFWLQTRNSLKFPAKALKQLDLSNDYTIKKFIKYTMKRQKKGKQQKQDQGEEEPKADMFQRRLFKKDQEQIYYKKDEEDNFSQVKESVKHSNTLTGRQNFMNSCSKETEREKIYQ